MRILRACAALIVVFSVVVSALGGTLPGRAQVDEAEREAEAAEEELKAAYAVVDAAVANRDEIEAELFATLIRYEDAAAELAAANADLDRIAQSLVFAAANASAAEGRLDTQAVAAYMEAVATVPAVVLDTQTVEDAIVVDHAFRAGQQDTLSRLDELLVMRRELEAIRARFASQRDQVDDLATTLAQESDQLSNLFDQANAQVSDAFRKAKESEASYRIALDAVQTAQAAEAERQRQEEEERRRQEEAARAATTTTVAAATEDTQSTAEVETWPPIPISSRTMSWRPTLEIHLDAALVLDALVIMECESHGNPDAVNPYSGAAGLFQFLPGTWAVASVRAGVGDRSVFDGEANIVAASWLAGYYKSRGYDPWRPWSCRFYL